MPETLTTRVPIPIWILLVVVVLLFKLGYLLGWHDGHFAGWCAGFHDGHDNGQPSTLAGCEED